MATIEQRILTAQTSLRAMSEGDEMVLVGYAARFNVLSHDLGNYRERIAPGAFTRSIAAGDDVVCTFNHDSNSVLGRTKSGTLKLAEDDKGLAFRCQLDRNQESHRSIHASVKRGDISSCSFAFQCPEDGCDFDQSGTMEDGVTRCNIRTLRNVKLLDCSVVTHPAYPNTAVDARAAVVASAPASDIHSQIRVFNARNAESRKRAQKLLAEHKPLDAETLLRAIKMEYSDDVVISLRAAAYSRQFAFEAGPLRYQQGQANDPTASLRDDDDFDPADADDKESHERAATWHRAVASKAKTMERGARHFAAADKHDKAARLYPDVEASRAARASSLSLKDIS